MTTALPDKSCTTLFPCGGGWIRSFHTHHATTPGGFAYVHVVLLPVLVVDIFFYIVVAGISTWNMMSPLRGGGDTGTRV